MIYDYLSISIILTGTFAKWYWTRNKKDVPCCAVGTNIGMVVFNHLGTIAFGSLVIAIIRFIRYILKKIENTLKKSDNDVTKCYLKCCSCCLWCLEKFMKYFNK